MKRKPPRPLAPAAKTQPALPPWPPFPLGPEPGPPVNVETPGYRVRSLRPSDASTTVQGWLADPALLWGLNLTMTDWPVEKIQRFIASFDNRTRYLIGILAKPTLTLIGFYTIDINLSHRIAHLSVGIGDRTFWGKNVLLETTPALIDHLFEARSIEKVSARIIPANKRILFNFMNSKRFFFEGKLIGELRAPNGERQDVLSFAALKGRTAKP
jgi:RimJ/RimL family protein N-acetyltransferase